MSDESAALSTVLARCMCFGTAWSIEMSSFGADDHKVVDGSLTGAWWHKGKESLLKTILRGERRYNRIAL